MPLIRKLVGAIGFEPMTPCAQGRCATRLRYAPTKTAGRKMGACTAIINDRPGNTADVADTAPIRAAGV